MKKFLVFALLIFVVALHFSCTYEHESAEELLRDTSSSSFFLFSSSSLLGGGDLVFCQFSSGCSQISEEACSLLGTVVSFCPEPSSSSSLPFSSSSIVFSSSSSLPGGTAFCMLQDGTCDEMESSFCVVLGGTPVQSCTPSAPLSSSSAVADVVEIGGKTWMAKNLNLASATGISICYDLKETNCTLYGRLYNWDAAMSVCSVAGAGWRLPTKAELTAAIDYGFSAQLGGSGDYYGGGSSGSYSFFDDIGYDGNYWSASEYSTGNPYSWSYRFGWDYWEKDFLYSVRCIKD